MYDTYLYEFTVQHHKTLQPDFLQQHMQCAYYLSTKKFQPAFKAKLTLIYETCCPDEEEEITNLSWRFE